MPHVNIHYTPNLEAEADMARLCRTLADVLVAQRDAAGRAVFPPGGTRVLAYPAAHFAVADGQRDYASVYVNVRIAAGRPEAAVRAAGDAMLACIRAHFAELFARRLIGITLQIDEGAQVYDAKHSNIHPLFAT